VDLDGDVVSINSKPYCGISTVFGVFAIQDFSLFGISKVF